MFGRKSKIGWNGDQYEITVTMELVETIDNSVNVLATAIELDKGGIPKVTLVAKLYSILLNSVGVQATQDEIYESIMANPVEVAGLTNAARNVISLCFPQLETSERTAGKKEKG